MSIHAFCTTKTIGGQRILTSKIVKWLASISRTIEVSHPTKYFHILDRKHFETFRRIGIDWLLMANRSGIVELLKALKSKHMRDFKFQYFMPFLQRKKQKIAQKSFDANFPNSIVCSSIFPQHKYFFDIHSLFLSMGVGHGWLIASRQQLNALGGIINWSVLEKKITEVYP